jgi:hypothetical protein
MPTALGMGPRVGPNRSTRCLTLYTNGIGLQYLLANTLGIALDRW